MDIWNRLHWPGRAPAELGPDTDGEASESDSHPSPSQQKKKGESRKSSRSKKSAGGQHAKSQARPQSKSGGPPADSKKPRHIKKQQTSQHSRKSKSQPRSDVDGGSDGEAQLKKGRRAKKQQVREQQTLLLENARRDRELAAAAPSRWQPDINPASAEFTKVLRRFNRKLQDRCTTIDEILRTHFSPFERQLLIPVERRRNPALADIQARNKRTYAKLFRTKRFEPYAPSADLAFKLTMVHFGLPVAPMKIDFGQNETALLGESEDDEMIAKAESSDEPADGWLRFLNKYSVRMFEWDGMRHADPMLEAYYAYRTLIETGPAHRLLDRVKGPEYRVSMGLRGGAGDEGDAEYKDLGPSDDDSDYEVGVGGVEAGLPLGVTLGQLGHVVPEVLNYTNIRLDRLRTDFSLDTGCPVHVEVYNPWLPMYGYQGIVWFRAGSLYSYVDAVDRLLSLDNRAGVAYKIYLLDRAADYSDPETRNSFLSSPDTGFRIQCAGVGDYSNDRFAWKWVLDHLFPHAGALQTDIASAYQKVLFVTGPSDPVPWVWEPEPDQPDGPSPYRVLKLTLGWEPARRLNRPDVAYLRMPKSKPKDKPLEHFTNSIGSHITQAIRLLATGRIGERPGRPAIPDAFFVRQGNRTTGTYGGQDVPLQFAQHIAESWMMGSDSIFQILAQTPVTKNNTHNIQGKASSDRFSVCVPGFGRWPGEGFLEYSQVKYPRSAKSHIIKLLKEAIPQQTFKHVTDVQVFLPGETFFTVSEKPLHQLEVFAAPLKGQGTEADADWEDIAQALDKHFKFLQLKRNPESWPQFVALRPQFRDYTIRSGKQSTSWTLWNTNLKQFRKTVTDLVSKDQGKAQQTHTTCIVVSQGDKAVAELRPRFLITPETEEAEWRWIRQLIVDPDVTVELREAADVKPDFGDVETEQPFGFRNIYRTPEEVLYPGMDVYPNYEDRMDLQLFESDAIPGLLTYDAGTEQPESTWGCVGPLHKPTSSMGLPADLDQSPDETLPDLGLSSNYKPRPINPVEKAAALRARSYAHPLSVHSGHTIPINGPPLESLLKIGGGNMPVVSLSVLTPTETRRMQRDYFDMRNLLLKRSERCPYAGCGAIYPINEPEIMQQHLYDVHVGNKCNFCNEILFEHWPTDKKKQHFEEKHADVLTFIGTNPKDTPDQSDQPPPAPEEASFEERTPKSAPRQAPSGEHGKKATTPSAGTADGGNKKRNKTPEAKGPVPRSAEGPPAKKAKVATQDLAPTKKTTLGSGKLDPQKSTLTKEQIKRARPRLDKLEGDDWLAPVLKKTSTSTAKAARAVSFDSRVSARSRSPEPGPSRRSFRRRWA